jgi:large subunit ribosomal protein L6e
MAKARKNGTTSRNKALTTGVGAYSRSAMFARKGRWAKKGAFKTIAKPAKAALKVKTFGKDKRTIQPKDAKFYPTEKPQKSLRNSRAAPKPTKLRASIAEGQVLILLAGKFRGHRVVFLKQLPSGLLLVTGPYKVNGVPVRRVNQRYVIATSTKVDLAGVSVDAKFNDAYFAKAKKAEAKKTEGEFFADKKAEKKAVPAARKDDQKALDAAILKAVDKTPSLRAYLGSTFSLHNGQYPHQLKF